MIQKIHIYKVMLTMMYIYTHLFYIMPSYILCAFRAPISCKYIYIYISEKCFDILWIWCGVPVRSVHILWAEEAVEIMVMNAETHKHVIVSGCLTMCEVQVWIEYVCFVCLCFGHPIFYLHADRILRLGAEFLNWNNWPKIISQYSIW